MIETVEEVTFCRSQSLMTKGEAYMKKLIISLFLLAIMVTTLLVTPICAALRWTVIRDSEIDLTIRGTTAGCTLEVISDDSSAKITATIKLQKKGLLGIYTTKKTWDDVSATGTMNFYDTYSPVDEGEYRLTADIDVIGTSGSDSISKTASATK